MQIVLKEDIHLLFSFYKCGITEKPSGKLQPQYVTRIIACKYRPIVVVFLYADARAENKMLLKTKQFLPDLHQIHPESNQHETGAFHEIVFLRSDLRHKSQPVKELISIAKK